MIIGFFVFAISFIKLKSVISSEANLYIGTLNFSKRATLRRLNGELNSGIFNFLANLKASTCHLNGV